MKKSILLLILLCLCNSAYGVEVIRTNTSFEETARIDNLEQIKVNEVPKTTYTPKNVRKQYNMYFQGKNNDGSSVMWSTPITDYDTKIMDSILDGNNYYIQDNTGKLFKTGEHTDLTPLQNDININKQNIQTNTQNIQVNKQNIETNRQNIQTNTQNIQVNTNNINNLNKKVTKQGQNINQLKHQVSNLQQEMRSGLATVTALTSLHPNPRANGPIELSLGVGMYKDQCAGAAGLFVHPTDNVMIQGGVAFGNSDDWAGYVGVTFSFGGKRK